MGRRKGPHNFLAIGAGARGSAYARAVCMTSTSGSARIAAVAEPDGFKRREFGRNFIWGQSGEPGVGQEFTGWKEWIGWEDERRAHAWAAPPDALGGGKDDGSDDDMVVITGVFVCTLDESHAEILRALAHLNLHVLCEKPLALSLEDCLAIRAAYTAQSQQKIFSIGHVLRYSPHNILLRRLLLRDRAIGEVVSLEHTEPIGWWHFSHSYVRGNWRHATPEGVGTLLTKSCHDIDFILWLLCSPADATDLGHEPHLPTKISSTGHLSYFKKSRKPMEAGAVTNCLDCSLSEEGCPYSAKKVYRDKWLRQERDTGWPLKIVLPEIEDMVKSSGWEAAEVALMKKLAEDYNADTPEEMKKARGWYGRCIYECSNNIMDDQTVTISWDEEPVLDGSATSPIEAPTVPAVTTSTNSTMLRRHRGPKSALFHLTFATAAQCDRRGRIYGTAGEIAYDSKRISVYTFSDEKTIEHVLPLPGSKAEKSHGGGDVGLAKSFVDAVSAAEEGVMTTQQAQRRYVGGDLDEMVRSHAVVFRAEEARMSGSVLEFERWWEGTKEESLKADRKTRTTRFADDKTLPT